ncbi:hypothetical protein NL676_026563 [Syzygium grande]|nr:hypothetical protein NL676_026563 [Syzygium grande]
MLYRKRIGMGPYKFRGSKPCQTHCQAPDASPSPSQLDQMLSRLPPRLLIATAMLAPAAWKPVSRPLGDWVEAVEESRWL